MQSVAVLVVLLRSSFAGFSDTISRRAGLSSEIKESLEELIDSARARNFSRMLRSAKGFGARIIKNRYAQVRFALLPPIIVLTFMAFASGRLSLISLALASHPVFAAVFSYVWLKETPTKSTIIGSVIMMIGVCAVLAG